MKAASRSMVVRKASVRLLVEPLEEGSVVYFYLGCTLVRLLPQVPVLESEAVGIEFGGVLYGRGPCLGGWDLVLPCHKFYLREVGAGVHVFHKNYDFLIIWAGDTDGDGQISTAG